MVIKEEEVKSSKTSKEKTKEKGGASKFEDIPSKPKCICEICTCGGHRCPHNDFKIDHIKEHLSGTTIHETGSTESQEQYKSFSSQMERGSVIKRGQTTLQLEGKMELLSSYGDEFQEKHGEKTKRFKHDDNLHLTSGDHSMTTLVAGDVGGHHGQMTSTTSKRANEQQSLSTSSTQESSSMSMQQSSSAHHQQEMSSSSSTMTSAQQQQYGSSSMTSGQQQQFGSSSMTTAEQQQYGSSSMTSSQEQFGSSSMTTGAEMYSSDSLQRSNKKRLRGGVLESVPDEYLYPRGIKIVSTNESLSELERNLAKGPGGAVEISSTSKTKNLSSGSKMESSSSTHATESVQESSSSSKMLSSDSKIADEIRSYTADLKSSAFSDSNLLSQSQSLNVMDTSEFGISSDAHSSSTRKVLRGPATTKRVLKGGKLESVFVEGDVIGFEDELASFHQSLQDKSDTDIITSTSKGIASDTRKSGYSAMEQSVYSSESSTNQGITKSHSEYSQSASEGRARGGDGEITTKTKTVVYDSGLGPSPISTHMTTRSILRGGKVVNVTQQDHTSSDVRESLRMIQESSDDLKHLGQFTSSTSTQQITDKSSDKKDTSKKTSKSTTSSNVSESMIKSMSENIDTSSSSIITEQIARQQQYDANRVRGEYRGSKTETVTGGKVHDIGDVKGLTVVTHSKSSMEQTEDQKLAQAQLQSLTTSSSVYGVNIESSLRSAKIKGIEEREISRGVVRLSELGLETTENVEKSITEIKTSKVSDSIEIDERIESKTTSTDTQTFRYEEMSEEDRRTQMSLVNQRNRVTGSALIEDSYDVSTKFDSRDKYDKITTAVEDERQTATTFLEQVDNRDTKVEKTSYIVYPRQTAIRQSDNLRVEEGTSTNYLSTNRSDYDEKKSSTTRGTRRNTFTKTEGDMTFTTTASSEYYAKTPEERPTLQRQNTWTKLDGDMTMETTTRGEFKEFPYSRQEIRRHEDNLKVETGEFRSVSRSTEDYCNIKGERSQPITQADNLKPEGPFYGKVREDAPKGDRAKPIKYTDNLKPEGEFYKPVKETLERGERAQPIKHGDNLYPEGAFYQKPKEKPQTGEKAKPIRQLDNLHPEGEFYQRPEQGAPLKGERADVKRPVDNLKPEGEFYKPVKETLERGERAQPIKHGDNLYPEGAFYQKPKEKPQTGEKAKPIRQLDNLHPEGEFYQRPEQGAPLKGERADVKRPVDNLKMEGIMYSDTKKTVVMRGERAEIRRHEDNLKVEDSGDLYFPIPSTFKDTFKDTRGVFIRGDRFETKRHESTLKLEGELDFSNNKKYSNFTPSPLIERRHLIIPKDNLMTTPLTGHGYENRAFEDILYNRNRHKIPSPTFSEYSDSLSPFNDVMANYPHRRETNQSEAGYAVNIYGDKIDADLDASNGNYWESKNPAAEDMTSLPDMSRLDTMRFKDHLYLVGRITPEDEDHYNSLKFNDATPDPGRRMTPLPPIYSQEINEDIQKGYQDHKRNKRNVDNGYYGGEFTSRVVGPAPKGERRKPIRPEDTLHPEGDFYDRPKENIPVLKGERYDVKKHQDNLRMEGKIDFIDKKTTSLTRGDRALIVKRTDNLKVGEGEMQSMTTQKSVHQSSLDSRLSKISKESGVMRKQTSSSIVLGDDIGDARFEKTTTAKRTTVENRNLENGHMTVNKTIESKTTNAAETRVSSDRSTEQKILSQSMSAKSGYDQSMILNDVRKTGSSGAQIQSSSTIDKTAGAMTSSSSQMTSSQQSSHATSSQLHANQKGTKEVQVTREVTVTKRNAPSGGQIVTTTTTSTGKLPSQHHTSSSTEMTSSQLQSMTSEQRRRHEMASSSLTQSSATTALSRQEQEQLINSSSKSHQAISSESRSTKEQSSSSALMSQTQSSTDRTKSTVVSSDMAAGGNRSDSAANSTFVSSLRSTSDNLNQTSKSESQSRSQIFVGQSDYGSNSMDRRLTSSVSTSYGKASSPGCAIHSNVDNTNLNINTLHGSGGGGNINTRISSGSLQQQHGSSRNVMSSASKDSQRYSYSNNQQSQMQQSMQQSRSQVSSSSSQVIQHSIGYSGGMRAQKIIHSDNLTLGKGTFEGQASSKTYGHYQIKDRVVPVRGTQQSSISLGSFSTESGGISSSTYRKQFIEQKITPCPASMIESSRSGYKLERQTSSHKFYMPRVSD